MTRAPVDNGFYQTPSQQLGQPAAAQSARLRLESPRLNVASLARRCNRGQRRQPDSRPGAAAGPECHHTVRSHKGCRLFPDVLVQTAAGKNHGARRLDRRGEEGA